MADEDKLDDQDFLAKIISRVKRAGKGALNIAQGAVEIPLSLATGTAAFPLALATGTRAGLTEPPAKSGRSTADQAFLDTLQRFTYAPRSEAGQEGLEKLGEAAEKLKIPPYVPGVGPMLQGAKMAASRGVPMMAENAMLPGPGERAAQIGAVKQPGGHWTPQSQATLMTQIVRGDAPEHVGPWALNATKNYLAKQAGTDRDPLNRMMIGPDTYEQVMDRSIRGAPYETIHEQRRPPNARPGETVWHIQPEHDWMNKLSQAGLVANEIPADRLNRMTIPQLLIEAEKIAALKAKEAAKRQGNLQEDVKRITAMHPEPPVLETPQGKWLRFHQGMDPEYMKLGLSADTCVGDHCLGGITHGSDRFGYKGWTPLRNTSTGAKWPTEGLPPDSALHRTLTADTNAYIRDLISGKGDVYSLRTPEGLSPASMNVLKDERPIIRVPQPREPQVRRSEVRAAVGHRNYNPWQQELQRREVPLEQRLAQNPGGGENVPDRGMVNERWVRQMLEHNPALGDQLAPILARLRPAQVQQVMADPQVRMLMNQFYGPGNRPVSPMYNQISTDMMRQQQAAGLISPRRSIPVNESGVGSQGVKGIDEIVEELKLGIPNNNTENAIQRYNKLKKKPALDKIDAASYAAILKTLGFNDQK